MPLVNFKKILGQAEKEVYSEEPVEQILRSYSIDGPDGIEIEEIALGFPDTPEEGKMRRYRITHGGKSFEVPTEFYSKGMGGLNLVMNASTIVGTIGVNAVDRIVERLEKQSAAGQYQITMDDGKISTPVPLSTYLKDVSVLAKAGYIFKG